MATRPVSGPRIAPPAPLGGAWQYSISRDRLSREHISLRTRSHSALSRARVLAATFFPSASTRRARDPAERGEAHAGVLDGQRQSASGRRRLQLRVRDPCVAVSPQKSLRARKRLPLVSRARAFERTREVRAVTQTRQFCWVVERDRARRARRDRARRRRSSRRELPPPPAPAGKTTRRHRARVLCVSLQCLLNAARARRRSGARRWSCRRRPCSSRWRSPSAPTRDRGASPPPPTARTPSHSR